MIEQKIMDILESIDYGFIDENGVNICDVDEEEWESKYYLLTPDELLETKCGVCWDQVELERKLFEENNIKVDTYFIYLDDSKNLPSHTFLVYEKNNKYYWFEHSWYIYRGIHEYNSLNELLLDVTNKHVESRKDELEGEYEIKLFKYKKPNFHITCTEFYDYINTQERIDINNL